jgi:hypothetical protein
MRKLRRWFVFLAILLIGAPLLGGVSQAQDTYTLQYITSITSLNYLSYVQGISGFNLSLYGDSAEVNVGFNNFEINGVYNRNVGIGSFRNQGSVAFINIEPNQDVLPLTYSGQMFSQGNRVMIGNFNYAVNLNINNLRGSGLIVLDVVAGSFCNQFTSLTFNMGKNAIPTTPPTNVLSVTQGNPTVVSLTNQQMQEIAATQDNQFVARGQQNAAVTVQGATNLQGISAITLSAGINNQVSHNVSVNIDTAK